MSDILTKRSRGRPRGSDEYRKDVVVRVRLTQEQYERMREMCENFDMPQSRFCRNAVTFYYNFLKK